ncbi:MAG: aminodeoxychorismate/anthranilate synthase component II [Phycisphaerales bacterium]|nr:aminodeoxychorismate/anthranilate synthase component II [Phycisphaerales bacterium]
MLLLIDHYDSFTFNLVGAIGALGWTDMRVVRHDELSVEACEALRPSHVVLSPGPCTPKQAGISVELVRRLAGRTSILGVCLGHQCIAEAFGMRVVRAGRLMHGKTSLIHHDGAGVYTGLPNPFRATRYHSLIVDEATIGSQFVISARSEQGELMGVRHRTLPIEGVQFHPESYLTECGDRLLARFLGLSPNPGNREIVESAERALVERPDRELVVPSGIALAGATGSETGAQASNQNP